jgi:hypothetical protein
MVLEMVTLVDDSQSDQTELRDTVDVTVEELGSHSSHVPLVAEET